MTQTVRADPGHTARLASQAHPGADAVGGHWPEQATAVTNKERHPLTGSPRLR